MPLTAAATLEREFLTIRAKILEIAASLDRLDRADGRGSTGMRDCAQMRRRGVFAGG